MQIAFLIKKVRIKKFFNRVEKIKSNYCTYELDIVERYFFRSCKMAFFPIVPLSKNDLLEMNYNWNKFCSWKTEAEGPNLFQQEDELVSDGGHGFEGGDAGGALADVWLFHHICIISGAEPVMVRR